VQLVTAVRDQCPALTSAEIVANFTELSKTF
jgi:hypothetical protein